MTGKVALQLNAILGTASLTAACAIMWLLLTRPVYVVSTVATGDYAALASAIGHQISLWIRALLYFV